MKKRIDAKKAIQIIAMREGMTVEEVRQRMKIALLLGLRSQDRAVQVRWQKIPCEGAMPTPEELITYLATQVDAEKELFTIG